MIKKSIITLFVFVISFLFIGSVFISAQIIDENNNDDKSLEVSDEDKHNVYFDCEPVFESSKNMVNIKLIDDYKFIPTIIGNGNITYNIISSDYCINEFELLLPQEDGKLELMLYFGDKTVRKNIFSSYRNGIYGVSIASLYYAQDLVGNLPYQEYMDNDITKGEEMFIPTPDNISGRDNEQNNRDYPPISGTLRWEDDNNQLHYLCGVKVKLADSSNYAIAYTYTNSSGYYELPGVALNGYYRLHIYSKNEKIEVKKECEQELYEKIGYMYVDASMGYVYDYDFSVANDGDLARAMQVFAAASNFANYAISIASPSNGVVPLCQVFYPCATTDTCYYCVENNIGTICLCEESASQPGCPSVAGSWDVIGHEYGHHLQRFNFFQNVSGEHSLDYNCLCNLITVEDPAISSLYDSRIPTIKNTAASLSFCEAWPTFFSIVAQKSFNVGNVPYVGDNIYKDYDTVEVDLSAYNNYGGITNKGGETDEAIIIKLLFRLWDNSQLVWDTVSFSFSSIWSFMRAYNPANLSEFIGYMYSDSYFSSYYDSINLILERYAISPYNIQIDQTSNYYVRPTFSWESGNKDVQWNNLIFRFSNTRFILSFYTPNNVLMFETGSIYDNYYTLTDEEWNQILLSNIASYKVRIRGYAPYGVETGPYYSAYHTFNKPTGNNNYFNDITISNSRYYENSFVITAGTSRQFNITFDHSGNKLIQTFGSEDTKMWLYNSNNTLVVPMDDDSGSGLNSLVFANLSANSTYKLIIAFYDSEITDYTKLSIISYGGDYQNNNSQISEYEDIYQITNSQSITYNTYVTQYNATVITWKPNVSGNYVIELNSVFDNYLYVIDSSSATSIVEDIDYNDDYCYDEDEGLYTSNARLNKYCYSNVTYMIVINQYFPFENGGSVSLYIHQ